MDVEHSFKTLEQIMVWLGDAAISDNDSPGRLRQRKRAAEATALGLLRISDRAALKRCVP
ncbi:hypothetical protein [Methylobacterium nigriterrae]|uniref:hypothetical protein n=1 Tax=Methylobacterium nigriterrae TaxID=3127512 RepID=UPI003014091B